MDQPVPMKKSAVKTRRASFAVTPELKAELKELGDQGVNISEWIEILVVDALPRLKARVAKQRVA